MLRLRPSETDFLNRFQTAFAMNAGKKKVWYETTPKHTHIKRKEIQQNSVFRASAAVSLFLNPEK